MTQSPSKPQEQTVPFPEEQSPSQPPESKPLSTAPLSDASTAPPLPTSMDIPTRYHDLIYTDWMLIESQFDPAQLRSRETVFTIGNGYLGTRGIFEEGYPDALPATLVHGVYDDVPGVYTELANCPDWLSLVVIVNGERFRLDLGKIVQYERKLDLRHGLLSRSVRWRSPTGNKLDLRFERFSSLADHQVLGLRCQITPIDFNGTIEVQSSINGYPDNQGFDHWEQLDRGKMEQGVGYRFAPAVLTSNLLWLLE